MNTAATHTSENEVTILARIILGNEHSQLSPEMARHILDLRFSDRDKARMHDLAVRNQEDALSPAEKEEMLAFGKAGDLLAISSPRPAARSASNPRNMSRPQMPMDAALVRLVRQRAGATANTANCPRDGMIERFTVELQTGGAYLPSPSRERGPGEPACGSRGRAGTAG